ncbi:TlpA disulfide reductase family protein [Natronococcus sp.]|uniref:TlpA family protein disulfide reductase n=1 Tax=Natronococcus sp. TaxID=35747 RepID=UPI0025F041B5|nr:TlpA disulfide reductase family protein [Natronococcus sp.]
MRRRNVLAGVASAGTLAGAGALAVYGLPGDEDEEPRHDPVTIDTVEAAGSSDGTQQIPAEDSATFVDLFATTCGICKEQMPALGEAYDRVGDDVTFVSITNENEDQVSDAELADWWDEYDGHWAVGRDATSDLIVHYGSGTPIGVLFDSDGVVRWEESGRKESDEIVSRIEDVLESDTER